MNCKICDNKIHRNEQKLSIRGLGKVHVECYKQKLLKKYTVDYVDNKINTLIESEEYKKEQRKTKRTLKKQRLEQEVNKNKENFANFIEYIHNIYDINIPNILYIKLANITNGTYRGLKEPISYEDLLAMFISKQQYLSKIYQSNIAKGKQFNKPIDRFNYDLAIIINKYDSYKQWKEKQKIIQADIQIQNKKNKEEAIIDYDKINKNRTVNNEVDIIDILEDIY
ncbi:TPA: hypothetical protein LA460_000102 [Clostridium botulinum]|nr:hypothetical protein [Clostridium botulinum]HBJ1652707.1 hypothetical protein [Clostridium botulinum]